MQISLLRRLVHVTATPALSWRKALRVGYQIGIPALVIWVLASCTVQAQTWTQLANNNPKGGCGTMNLLTDGTVIVQTAGQTNTFSKLTPDATGNYINGTWSPAVANMAITRLYTGNIVMPNGKYFVLGGEYSNAGGWTNTGEIYDPLANIWTATAPFPQTQFGDGQAVLLPNGKIFAGYLSSPQCYLYTPSTNTWAPTGSKIRNDRNNEETWLLLPGGDVLCYEIFSSPASGPGFAQRYNSATGVWADAGSVPVPLSSSGLGFELGPGGVLPNGKVIQTGANNNLAIYDPAANTWAAGPTLPVNMGCDDTPGAVLPDGHFLFAADTVSPAIFTPPTRLFDYDYTTNLVTDVTPTGALGTALAGNPAYVSRMVVLPNGHLLFSHSGSDLWEYTPAGSPQANWRPTITSITKVTPTSYTLTGTRLTGLSEGANYGDDAGQSTNYPIVRFTSSTNVVSYARTTNWTPGISLAGDNAPMTVDFSLPSGITNGTYQVVTIANGISSNSTTLTIGGGIVTASYNASKNALTLVGDAQPNTVTVTRNSMTGLITVHCLNGTKVNNSAADLTFTPVGKIAISAVLGDGDDSITLTNLDASTVDLKLGNGTDAATLNMCAATKLLVDGGPGSDTLVTTTSAGTIPPPPPPVNPNRIIKNVEVGTIK